MKTYINKSNDEIIKKHIANMNEFCIENIDFEQGKEQLQMIYRYYVKRFSSDEISYKNLIISVSSVYSVLSQMSTFFCVLLEGRRCFSPHSHIMSRMGISDLPRSVRLYSTLGGICGYSSRCTSWSPSSSFSVTLSVLYEISPMYFFISIQYGLIVS